MALQQTIAFLDTLKVNSDGTLGQFTVFYESTDSETGDPITTSTSFGSSLHFNSNQLTLIDVLEIHSTGLKIPNPSSANFPGGSRADESDLDSDPTTDQLFLATWSESPNWQTGEEDNSSFALYTPIFEIADGVNFNDATLNFVGVPANQAEPVLTTVPDTFTIVTNQAPTVSTQSLTIVRTDLPTNGEVLADLNVADADDAFANLTVALVDGNFDTDNDGNSALALSLTNNIWSIIVNDQDDLTTDVTSFDLTVEATDPLRDSSTGVVSVTITEPNQAPTVADKDLGLRLGNEITKYNKLENGDFLTTVNVTDADENVDTVAIISGNEDADGDGNLAFAQELRLVDGSWYIVVNDADDLNFANSQGYTLEIQATDTEGASDTGTVTFDITDKYQRINVSPEPLKIKSDGSTLPLTVQYESSDPTLGSFGLGLYFNSEVLDLQPVQEGDVLDQNSAIPNSFPADSRADESNNDGDDTTDQLFLTSWSDGSQGWPGTSPIDLYSVTFDVVGSIEGGTPINFTASTAQGFVADLPSGLEVTVNQLPVVVNNDTFSIVENSPNGTVLNGVLDIKDPDDALDTLTITDSSDAFDVQLIDGQFKLVVADSSLLDYETTQEFTFNVTATDPIGESSTGEVTVTLTNDPTDDTPPVTNGVITLNQAAQISLDVNVTSEATLANKVLYYEVDNAQTGAIDGVLPGQTGYLALALGRATDILLEGGSGANTTTGEFGTKTLNAGIYAPMLIANGGSLDNLFDMLEVNASNDFNGNIKEIVAYFAYGAASADGENHFKFDPTTNKLMVEDLHSSLLPGGEPNGGNWDYNDVEVDFRIL